MFGKTKDGMPEELKSPAPVQHFHSAAPSQAAASESANGVSSISAGMTVTGKIAGSGAVKILGRVEGDIFHRSLAIEENAKFEGTSRRDENAADKPRAAAVRPQATAHALVGEAGRKLNGAPEKEAQATPTAG